MQIEEIWLSTLFSALQGGMPYIVALEMADSAVKDFKERFREEEPKHV